jgi:nucleoside-diphosphate kinase
VSERSLVLVKPDGVQRGLVGEVMKRIETKGWKIIAFFKDLVTFITSAPLVAMVIEGPNAIAGWRLLMGATNPANANPGTIRGDLATETQNNVTHGSDSFDSAAREIALFFPGLK